MPGERKEPLMLHFLHDRFPFDVLIARIRNLAARNLTRHKRSVQLHPKPFAKLAVIGERAPDSRNRRLELDALLNLNTIIHHRQPPGCILYGPGTKKQSQGCTSVLTYLT